MRRGRVVATIAPARRGTGADLRRILSDLPPDDAWADDLRDIRRFAGEAAVSTPWTDGFSTSASEPGADRQERALAERYRILRASSGAEALEILRQLRARDDHRGVWRPRSPKYRGRARRRNRATPSIHGSTPKPCNLFRHGPSPHSGRTTYARASGRTTLLQDSPRCGTSPRTGLVPTHGGSPQFKRRTASHRVLRSALSIWIVVGIFETRS